MQATVLRSSPVLLPARATTRSAFTASGQTSRIRCGSSMDGIGHDFESFYRTEFPSMVALAHTICGDSQLAEDLAQEALTRAHKRWDELVDYDKPGAWLRRVTINLALTRRRRSMREVIGLGRQKLESLSAPEQPDSDVEVWEAVASLAPKQRAAIALFYQEDASTAEIAEILGCAVSTATSHLSQARQRLAGLLDQPVPRPLDDLPPSGQGRQE